MVSRNRKSLKCATNKIHKRRYKGYLKDVRHVFELERQRFVRSAAIRTMKKKAHDNVSGSADTIDYTRVFENKLLWRLIQHVFGG